MRWISTLGIAVFCSLAINAHAAAWCGHWYFSKFCSTPTNTTYSTRDLERLGEKIFFDRNLSFNRQQSCASCHDPATGFTDPDSGDPTSLGADGVSFGQRNSATLSYIGHVPDFDMALTPSPGLSVAQAAQNNPGVAIFELPLLDLVELLNQNTVLAEQSFGGFFLDGRAGTLKEQAKLPFFKASEMGLSSPYQLVYRLWWSHYSWEFRRVFGYNVFYNADRTLDAVATALAAFQRSKRFAPFNSKFDYVSRGWDVYSESEARGQALFNGSAGCFFCHTSPAGRQQLFSDFLYHNVGTPKNYQLLSNIGDAEFVDRGRFEVTGNPVEDGMFRTPTLRNIAKTAPYMHNGVFNTLHEVLQFYNTRDSAFESELRTQFTTPHPLMGNLGLSDTDIDDIVNFLHTLSDR